MTDRILPTSKQQLLDFLTSLHIEHKTTEHPAVFTVEEGNKIWHGIKGVHCKNLFLKDAKGKLWLVVAPANARVDLKALPAKIGSKRVSFGNEDLLFDVLGITKGSVTPFCIMNDKQNQVTVVLDKTMMANEFVNYHPLTNTATTTLTPDGLMTFMRACTHEPMIVDVIEHDE